MLLMQVRRSVDAWANIHQGLTIGHAPSGEEDSLLIGRCENAPAPLRRQPAYLDL